MRLRLFILALLIIGFFLILIWGHIPPAPVESTPAFSREELLAGNLVCFGDSLTEGQGAAPEESFPAILAQKLPFKVINAGRSGDTASGGLGRIETDVLEQNPKIVVVELGANDFFRTTPVGEVEKNLSTIIGKIKEKKALVILAGTPVSWAYRKMFKRVAKKTAVILIPDILEGILDQPKFMSDSIHPNKEGYFLIAQTVYQAIYKCLKKAGFPNIISENFPR